MLDTPPLRRVALLLALVACGEPSGPADGVPARIDPAEGNGQRGTVGQVLPQALVARVADGSGTPVPDVTVSFEVVSGGGSVASDPLTDASGRARATWTLGTSTSVEQVVQARVLGVEGVAVAVFRATATPGAADSFRMVSGDVQSRVAGAPLRDSLVVVIRDAFGNGVPGARVDWRASIGGGRVSPATSTTGPMGRARTQFVLGSATGVNVAVATTADFDSVSFTAFATPAPLVAAITPDTIVPGRLITFTGQNFAYVPDTEVRVGDVPAFLVSAGPDSVVARAPCVPSGTRQISLITNGLRIDTSGPVSVRPVVRLDPGARTVIAGPLDGCAEIAPPGSFLVILSRPVPDAPAEARLVGRAGPTASEASVATPDPAHAAARAPVAVPAVEAAAARIHTRLLDAGDRLIGQAQAPSTVVDPVVGDTVVMRVPAVSTDPCVVATEIRARVVASGARSMILEDVSAPLAGTADSVITLLHAEMESVMLPLLEANFGDALTRLRQNGGPRVRILLSPAVNALPGVSGFTSVGDLLDPSKCAAGNGVPVFYGFVPTDPASGYGNGVALTRANWYRLVRATVVHETKHLIAFATRSLAGEERLEDRWLEEGSALIAEELYARVVFGYGPNDNTTFRQSLFCERRPDSTTFPECRDKPLVMLNHFTLLARHMAGIETRTLFAAATPGDNGFYGAAWSLLRWTIDHSPTDEASFLHALTTDTDVTGRANLAARAGRPFEELFSGWMAALALDDRPGFVPTSVQQTFRGWNLRDIYAGLRQELPILFPRTYPLVPRTTAPGAFDIRAPNVVGGAAVFLEIGSLGANRQLLDLTVDAAAVPRITIIRLN